MLKPRLSRIFRLVHYALHQKPSVHFIGQHQRCRWFSTEKDVKKLLFALELDPSEWSNLNTSAQNKTAKTQPVNSLESSSVVENLLANDILADFLLDMETEAPPAPLDQILEKFSMGDFSDIKDEDSETFGARTQLKHGFSEEGEEFNLDAQDNVVGKETESDIIEDERDLFKEMFAKYSKYEDLVEERHSDLPNQVLSTLQDSYLQPNTQAQKRKSFSNDLNFKQTDSQKLDAQKELEVQVAESLKATTDYISSLQTRAQIMDFYKIMMSRYENGDYDRDTFYLRKQRNESNFEFTERQKLVFQTIETAAVEQPETPMLTSQTMPILFNHLLQTVCSKFYDGGLALTLFNCAKRDISTYAILCNQTTYNEMLKVYWVFFGKGFLYEVELILVEMMNNGFKGDLQTFAILKEILTTYHTMRTGQTVYNPCGMPIWSEENDRRAWNLGEKLRKIGSQFRDKQFFSQKPKFELRPLV